MKRITALLAIVAALLILTGGAAAQGEDIPYGSFEGLSWTFDMDSRAFTLTADGTGSVPAEAQRCSAALYGEDGKQLSVCLFALPPEGETATAELACAELPLEFDLRLYLTDALYRPAANAKTWHFSTSLPTCARKGYTIVSSEDGSYICRVIDTIEHSWGEWQTVREIEGVIPGLHERCCEVCGAREEQLFYPQSDMPILRLYGDISYMDKYTEAAVTAYFDGVGTSFFDYASLKTQGHTSLVYPKKNYMIKFFLDEGHTEKDKHQFYNWNRESKYVLKANYVDPSKCRNLACADLWYEICKCREGTKHIKNLFHYGATDGMPVAVYLNDEYLGLYDMTLHKDDDLYDLDKGQDDALMIVNHCTTEESLFRAPAAFTDESDWELEFCGSEDPTWAMDKLNALIDFVVNASDADFADKKQLKQHLNIDSAIDYMLNMYAFGLTNSYAKNLVLLSYGQDPWIFSAFDMEDAFGLYMDGQGVYEPTAFLPSCVDGVWSSDTGSLLWDRLLQCYPERIAARYRQLRETIFTEEHVLAEFEARTARIDPVFYEADRALYTNMPGLETGTQEQISAYLTARLALLDEIFVTEEPIEEETNG